MTYLICLTTTILTILVLVRQSQTYWEFCYKRAMKKVAKSEEEKAWLNVLWITQMIKCRPYVSVLQPYVLSEPSGWPKPIKQSDYKEWIIPRWETLTPSQWDILVQRDKTYYMYMMLYI